jgi:hypothetical protein
VIHRAPKPIAAIDNQQITENARRALHKLTNILRENIGDNRPKLKKLLDEFSKILSDDFTDFGPVYLGIFGNALSEFYELGRRELLAEDASVLSAIIAHTNKVLAHFKEWEDYLKGVKTPFADEETEKKAVECADQAIKKIVQDAPSLLGDDAKSSLYMLGELAKEESTPITRSSFLRAFRSLVRTIGAWTLDTLDLLGNIAKKSVIKVLERKTEAAVFAIFAYLPELGSLLSAEFASLKELFAHLIRLLSGG